MVDLHCHILPGLDDGPKAMEDSLAMAESAIADGITHVVATPHANSSHFFDYPKIRALQKELQSQLGNRLTLATGCDFHVSPENVEALQADAAPFCINQNDYLLVEFNEVAIPPAMDHKLHEIQLAGLRPVITHPERNSILRLQPERLTKWIRMGCYGQITGGSLTGRFGPLAQKDALRWIGAGLIHFIASDAHNLTSRPLRLSPAYDVVMTQFGEKTARALFRDNPLAAFEGRALPYVPELFPQGSSPRRKRFFFF